MAERGTLEVVGQLLGELLAPLAERLQSVAGARALFTELGLVLPDSFFARPAFAGTLQAGATAAGRLPDTVGALVRRGDQPGPRADRLGLPGTLRRARPGRRRR